LTNPSNDFRTRNAVFLLTEAKRIPSVKRTASNIGIGVDAAPESYRITLRIAADSWVIRSVSIVMQPCLAVEDLSREAQVVGER
jgi:hypothetical protein